MTAILARPPRPLLALLTGAALAFAVAAPAPAAAQGNSPAYCDRVASDYAKRYAGKGGTLRGAAKGAAGGAIGGAIFGSAGKGAGIGAGVGALLGTGRKSADRDRYFRWAYEECMRGNPPVY